jgi:hypothetical protein
MWSGPVPDLTKSQETAIEELHEIFVATEGRIVGWNGGAVIYELDGKGQFEIGKRGKQTRLEDVGAGAVENEQPPVPETEVAAEPSVEDTSVQTSEHGETDRGVSGSECAPGLQCSPGAKTSDEGAAIREDADPTPATPSSVDSSPQGTGNEGTNPPVSEPSQTAAGREPSRGNEGEGSVAQEPSPKADEVSDPGNGSRGQQNALIDPSQTGGGTVPVPSPQVSGPDLPHDATRDAAASETEVAVEQDSADLALPTGSVEPVPTFDQLPQAVRGEAYEALSLADERQITAELEGQALSSMVYGFKINGQQVYGLSWIGAREVVRAFNARSNSEIRISDQTPPVFEDVMVMTVVGWDEEAKKPIKEERPAIRCTVYGMDAAHGTGQWGTATVPRDQIIKKDSMKDGNYYGTSPDGFAANKALSKAQRNALEPMIPRQFVEELIALYKGKGSVEYIPGTGREIAVDRPPALTDDRAKAQMDRCRELYGEIKKIDGWQKEMPPAMFNRSMEACQHDHDRLDDFIQHLENLLARGQGNG